MVAIILVICAVAGYAISVPVRRGLMALGII